VLYFGAGSAVRFRREYLTQKSRQIGGPDGYPGRKPTRCHKKNQSRIASESLRMR
jgi:hypothetical protein